MKCIIFMLTLGEMKSILKPSRGRDLTFAAEVITETVCVTDERFN